MHVGELGQGEMLEIVNNSVAAANAVAVGERWSRSPGRVWSLRARQVRVP
ncbi:MAG TPA: hypothetical protein VGO80_24225 [Solirubrobacteraceae bacterium]|nr:hypothetical protein [Solirubrobacteraceae bacterium]